MLTALFYPRPRLGRARPDPARRRGRRHQARTARDRAEQPAPDRSVPCAPPARRLRPPAGLRRARPAGQCLPEAGHSADGEADDPSARLDRGRAVPSCGSPDITEYEIRIGAERSRMGWECRDCGHAATWTARPGNATTTPPRRPRGR